MEEEKSETYSNNMTEAMGAGMFNHFVLVVQKHSSLVPLGGVSYIGQTISFSGSVKNQVFNRSIQNKAFLMGSPKDFFGLPLPLWIDLSSIWSTFLTRTFVGLLLV